MTLPHEAVEEAVASLEDSLSRQEVVAGKGVVVVNGGRLREVLQALRDAEAKLAVSADYGIRLEAAEARATVLAGEVEGLRDHLAQAYEQGCMDTHKAIQAEPELALTQPEWCEFGEAASDYAASVTAELPLPGETNKPT